MSSPVIRGEDAIISAEAYRQEVRGLMLILWNVYNFFISYALIDGWTPDRHPGKATTLIGSHKNGDSIAALQNDNVLDQWIISLQNTLIKEVTECLEKYDTVTSIAKLHEFVNDLSTWYLRRSRDRVGPSAMDTHDREAFYVTMYEVLTTLCRVMAPFTPFLADEMYMNLTKEESVHLASWPEYKEELSNKQLNEEMNVVRKIVEIGHAKRKETGFKVRQPLNNCQISNVQYPISKEMMQLLKDELNVKEIEFTLGEEEIDVIFDIVLTPELKAEGEARDIVRKIQEERKMIGTTLDAKVNVTIPEYPESFVEYIKQNALVEIISKGEFKVEKVG